MQKELTTPHRLLDDKGQVIESGWAKQLIVEYRRADVRAGKFRIKEWDYYEIVNPDFGIVLLLYDIGYMANAVVKWMDFKAGTFEECAETVWFSGGAMKLPPSAEEGDAIFDRNGIHWECIWNKAQHRREFRFDFPKFRNGQGIKGEIFLSRPPDMETMVNVVPFKKKTQFVYVQKVNCMVPDGKVTVAGKEYIFNEANYSYGCLDWSRAVFPYHVEWRWCTSSGKVGGVPFGLNIDYGFGIDTNKSMIFYKNRGHHLDHPTYSFDKTDVRKDWIFESNDNRVNLRLKVVAVETGGTNFVVLKTKLLKVYGFFTGKVILDDGTPITIREEDKLFGSAEAVINYW